MRAPSRFAVGAATAHQQPTRVIEPQYRSHPARVGQRFAVREQRLVRATLEGAVICSEFNATIDRASPGTIPSA